MSSPIVTPDMTPNFLEIHDKIPHILWQHFTRENYMKYLKTYYDQNAYWILLDPICRKDSITNVTH